MFNLLDFDTQIFGFKVARILPQRLTSTELQPLLHNLSNQQAHLVYWQNDREDSTSQQAARQAGGYLASQQVSYEMTLTSPPTPPSQAKITRYTATKPTLALERLALEICQQSRFGTDPKLDHELGNQLYRVWIGNSVNGKVADQVWTARATTEEIGVITLKHREDCGEIGLLGVAPEYRGAGLGSQLIKTVLNYLWHNHQFKIRVVTQLSNRAACRLYERCGFQLQNVTNFYHFWLDIPH